ncbi:ABC transporter ATP-binding protein [Gracilibacillus sp. YIM 98692]|uniref:ABC transporter ATP-binding protein n=1 Tax=Gracilibacillus sp. YIM 98692 TaxID=2663532 RepID=UPI001F092E31|nr:ABC transporter ATP-binding protein [Gracilibacillus sp. YIM 98692]
MEQDHMISIQNLRVKFPNEKSFLFKDFSLSINPGEKVLLVGPSGSGKSTLLQILSGLIPNAVEVPVKYDSRSTNDSWGYVFQDPDVQFCMPYVDEEIAFVLENLAIPRNEMNHYIEKYLTQVGLHLDDRHTKIQELSGGMKQRLAIASVLALEPELLYLDEPTAMLDPSGTQQVWDTIKNVSEDKTVIIVEHKIEQVLDFVDRVVMIDQHGQLQADGTPDEVFTAHKQLFQQYGIWYPNVWEDYLNKNLNMQNQVTANNSRRLISFDHFIGYRNKQAKIRIDEKNIHSGEWICVTGENGAGKSTLLLSIMQLISTNEQIHYENSLFENDTTIYDQIGFVFQNPELQFVTNKVYDELAYSLKNQHLSNTEMKERIIETLRAYDLLSVKEKHPFQLSTGQKKRLSVATASITNPKLLLLDEPTFGQDAKNTFRIIEILKQLQASGTAIVMVTHDTYIKKYLSTFEWMVENGEIIEKQLDVSSSHQSVKMS